MKKLFLAISTVFLVLFGVMTISATAARYTELPITMNQSLSGSKSKFTMSDFEISVYPNETLKSTNTAYIYIEGHFSSGSSMVLNFKCYSKEGKSIKTLTKTMNSSDFYEYEDGSDWWETELNVPNTTAFIEVGTAHPGSWTNTYYYSNYMNVYSSDGRAKGIPDLLLPAYEKVGWHGPVWMYTLDGREKKVPYCDIKAYQKVGWYLWEDYSYKMFEKTYNSYIEKGAYSDAFYAVEWEIENLTGTKYESGLYSLKTNLMDKWRKKINGPLAYCSDYVSTSYDEVTITFRNVSYNTIKAYRLNFDCYDVFGNYIDDYTEYYYSDSEWILPGKTTQATWSVPAETAYIKNLRIIQVVYSDNTSWHK